MHDLSITAIAVIISISVLYTCSVTFLPDYLERRSGRWSSRR